MKKTNLFISTLIAIILFAGCSSEKDEAVKIEKPTLENTVWIENRGDITITVSFFTNDAKLVMASKALGERNSTSYRYAFVTPKVTMFPDDTSFAMLEGSVSGSTLVLTNTSTNKVFTTLTKQ